MQQKQTVQFAVEIKNGAINKVGKCEVIQPNINFKGGSIKWFDDSKLLKGSRKEGVSHEEYNN